MKYLLIFILTLVGSLAQTQPTIGQTTVAKATNGVVSGLTYYRATNNVSVVRNTDLVIVGPYDTAASGTANFGQDSGQTAYEWITDGHKYRIRQNGTIEQVKFYFGAKTAVTSFTVGVWRLNAAGTFDQIGVSANLISSVTASSLNTLSVSIPGTQEGDFVGGRLAWSSASALNMFARTGVSSVTNLANIDTATDTSAYDWRAQTATAGTVPVIECYMQAPNAVFIGDSIAAGHGASDQEHYSFIEATTTTHIINSMPYHVSKAFNWSYQNMGIGGQLITNINARLAADVVALKPKFAVFHMGRNDDIDGAGEEVAFTNHFNFTLAACRAAGIIPIVSLVLGGDDMSNANDLGVDTVNAALVNLINTSYPEAIIANGKPYLNTNSPTQSPSTNLYNFANDMTDDTIHPSPIGYRMLAQAIIDAISPPSDIRRVFAGDRILFEPGEVANGTVTSPAIAIKRHPRTGWDVNPDPTQEGMTYYRDGQKMFSIGLNDIYAEVTGGMTLGNYGRWGKVKLAQNSSIDMAGQAGDISSPGNGEFWFDTTTQTHRMRNGTTSGSASASLFRQSSATTVFNTVTESTLITSVTGTKTLNANFFTVGRILRGQVRGRYGTTGTPTLQIKVKLGSTTILDSGAVAMPNNATDKLCDIDFDIVCRTIGASGTVFGQGKMVYNDSTGQALLVLPMVITAAVTIDTTASQVVDVTATWGAADAANTIKSEMGGLFQP